MADSSTEIIQARSTRMTRAATRAANAAVTTKTLEATEQTSPDRSVGFAQPPKTRKARDAKATESSDPTATTRVTRAMKTRSAARATESADRAAARAAARAAMNAAIDAERDESAEIHRQYAARQAELRRVPSWDLDAAKIVRSTRALHISFLDDTPMDISKPPSFRLRDFRTPRLRKCTFDLDTVDWTRARLLGCGADGTVYRVRFRGEHDKGPFYALKLFWDAEPINTVTSYFGAQRECQNAALLQMIRASIDQANAVSAAAAATPEFTKSTAPTESTVPTAPPMFVPNPKSHYDALINFFAFTEEIRLHRHQTHEDPPDTRPVLTMPRFAKCYGWMRVRCEDLEKRMPRRLHACPVRFDKYERELQEGQDEYIAVVYEYIEDEDDEDDNDSDEESPRNRRWRFQERPKKAKNDPEKVAAVSKFLFEAGFKFCLQPLARNWKNGVLVDHSDIIGPRSHGWHHNGYRPVPVDYLLS